MLRSAFGRTCCAAILSGLVATHVQANEIRVPMPRSVIYPGDRIEDAQIEDMPIEESIVADATAPGAAVTDRSELVGRVARRTLLPGKPIARSSIDMPKIISNGATVRIVYDSSGVLISAIGQALQTAGVGELVRVRNIESGIVIVGIARSDGTIGVGGA